MTNGGSPLNLLCLLPVRNGVEHLPRYLDSVRRFSRGVIALDDGSTDRTATMLANDPCVLALLRNPRRENFLGWNDALNRSRLVKAAAAFAPDWVLWLDADETIATPDIPRLTAFLRTEAKPDVVYGLELLRMIGSSEKEFDKCKSWVYRLFAYRPGYTLPDKLLHFEPVPLEIDRRNWKRTRLRLAHFAGTNEARRQARYDKYIEVDPDLRWQSSYADILDPTGYVWKLKPLPINAKIVLD
ncbi:MAG: glycosyltransferase [Vitreimonas sp.]